MWFSGLRTRYSVHEDVGLIPSLAQWIKDLALVSCSLGHRCGLDLVLCLWCRLAAAAQIQPLAWECPCATGMVLKKKRKKKRLLHFLSSLQSKDE